MALRLGLLGAGISHSKMPRLQEYLGRMAAIPVSYSLIDGDHVADFDPVAMLSRLAQGGFHGVNVTHPYKQQIHKSVDTSLIPGHELIGSYNTLTFQGERVLGANTDFSGFQSAWKSRLGRQVPGAVVLCGAGGVGRAVAFALVQLGAVEVRVFDRETAQAKSLCTALKARGCVAHVIGRAQLTDAARDACGLANCTPLGMYGHAGNAFPAMVIDKQQWVFDAVYTPLHTAFSKICARKKIRCISGFDLWIHQGLDAFKVFTGVEIEPGRELIKTTLGWLD